MHPADQIERAYEREERQLSDDLAAGLITPEQYNKEMRRIQREMSAELRGAAEEAAEEAYRDFLGDW